MDKQIVKSESPDEKSLRAKIEKEKKARVIMTDYIKSQMIEGVDYGKIEGTTRTGGTFQSKPTLFKAGAEKFANLFGWRAEFQKDTDTWEMAGRAEGVFCYKCILFDKNGEVKGEGRGASSVKETNINGDINKAVKIAEKRSQLDATLRVGMLSGFFTQDMESKTKIKTEVKEEGSFESRKLDKIGDVTYENRIGTSKKGQQFDAWFPIDNDQARIYWSWKTFVEAKNKANQQKSLIEAEMADANRTEEEIKRDNELDDVFNGIIPKGK